MSSSGPVSRGDISDLIMITFTVNTVNEVGCVGILEFGSSGELILACSGHTTISRCVVLCSDILQTVCIT